ncbi:T9SS type A sorting domain-containing protein [Flammeovirga pectinis]|uniref:T9SS type A sorting domain-containing protein n=1 Tax=Flammeovirga pectinis TaxID=2494373 RepID=A0A3S9NZE6_9BACT|nr:T9SS type A sorting domain-containing protein [Flammeovirga pectinis]AZQ61306.1 T9SS type A sorting domain-containing protein [Flammeovirga pectinis]
MKNLYTILLILLVSNFSFGQKTVEHKTSFEKKDISKLISSKPIKFNEWNKKYKGYKTSDGKLYKPKKGSKIGHVIYINGDVRIKENQVIEIQAIDTLVINGDVIIENNGTLSNKGNLVIRGSLYLGGYDEITRWVKKRRQWVELTDKVFRNSEEIYFFNESNGKVIIKNNMIGYHPHKSKFYGQIAVLDTVDVHFHSEKEHDNHNKFNPKCFYYSFNNIGKTAKSKEAHKHGDITNQFTTNNKILKSTKLSKVSLSDKIDEIKENELHRLKPYLTKSFKDLPVELSSFSCTQEVSFTAINWTTAQEINNSHFIIEKSYDKKNFEKIDEVDGQGNSNVVTEYEIDVPTDKNKTVYYRLTQYDFDGKSESWIQAVMNGDSDKIDVSVYPNPTTDFIKVESNATDDSPMDYYLINASTGYKIKLTSKSSQYSSQKFDVSGLSQGIYILEVTQGNKRIYQKKIIKN